MTILNKISIISLILFALSSSITAQVYSFEDTEIPKSWTSNSGSIVIANNKYKLGVQSLRWNWVANSKISILNPDNIATASTNKSGGITIWIYNANPLPTAKLVFSGVNSSNEVKCQIDFNLNFKGWRYLSAKFVKDMGHDKTPLTQITIQAPSLASGVIYFDCMTLPTRMQDSVNADAQFFVKQDPTIDDFQGVRAAANFVGAPIPSAAQLVSIDTIIKRIDVWFLSNKLYPKASEYTIRKKANTQWMSDGVNLIDKINFKAEADGTLSAGALFSEFTAQKIYGSEAKKFNEYHKLLLPTALDFRINGSKQSKTALLNMYDWYNDQGWADGSGMGNMMYEKIRVGGYAHSVFLMRNELGADRLAREVNTMNWYSLLGSANMPFKHAGENADMIRTMVMVKLYAAVLQPDVNKRVAAMTALTNYFNNAFAPAPGYCETFKPDFTGYHHYGPYLGHYYSDAIYAASLICYLLHDTLYALSEATYSNLKQSLMNYRLFCANYDVPSSANARFPGTPTKLNEIVPAYAYVALSKSKPDNELLAVFSKYWQPNTEPMKSLVARAGVDITQKRTLGEIELCITAAKLAVPAEKNVKASFYMPYAGLLVNRGESNLVSVNGYGKYVAGFESVFPKDNLYGRYLHFGQIEYTSFKDGRKNNAYNHSQWDWNRLPGTTSKYLNKKELYYLTTGSHRVFGDQTFLGGAAMNDSISAFSFQLHDNKFDSTFYANKSVFCFGNTMVCLGSNITNSSTNARTETTILQQELREGESIAVNGKELKDNDFGVILPVISDNLGNSFVVKKGSVDFVKTDSMIAAVINHGFAPKNLDYCYYMIVQGNNKQVAKFCNKNTDPIQVLRQDSIAHIVKQNDKNIIGYSIFNSKVTLNDDIIKDVNTPSILLMSQLDKTTTRFAIADPDLRRPQFKGDEVSESAQSLPFTYEIILNGVYELKGKNAEIQLLILNNTTKISFTCIEGKTYVFDLNRKIQ